MSNWTARSRSVTRKALREITSEGKSLPQTVEAWRELIRLALAEETPADKKKALFDDYAAVLSKLPRDPAQLTRLLDLWQQASNNGLESLGLSTLQKIYRDFPLSSEALSAYEALAQYYRAHQDKERLTAVDESIRQMRALLWRQSEEQNLATEFEKHLAAKNSVDAEKALFEMTPGLVPTIDCWACTNA